VAKANKPRREGTSYSPAFTDHSGRTKLLNNLASPICVIVGKVSDGQKPGKFYRQLNKRFRTQPSDNRFLLLYTLKDMDIHPRYTLGSIHGDQQMVVKTRQRKINVTLKVRSRPKEDTRTNAFRYELLLLTWNQSDTDPSYSRKRTELISFNNPVGEFEFSFETEADAVHWLLCLKLQQLFDGKPVSWKVQAMRIMEVGTFDKRDILLLKKYIEAEKKKNASAKKEEEDIPVVKAKKRK
jgi:hypothetical protein